MVAKLKLKLATKNPFMNAPYEYSPSAGILTDYVSKFHIPQMISGDEIS